MGLSKRFWIITLGAAIVASVAGYYLAPYTISYFNPPKPVVFELITPDVTPADINAAPIFKIRVEKVTIDRSRTILLNHEIDQVTAEIVTLLIMKLNMDDREKPIFLMLDSPGGDILYGKRIIGAVQTSEAPVITINSGVCASMCAQIHVRGFKRWALPGTTIMYHPGWTSTEGKLQEVKSFVGFVLREYMRMSASVADRAGINRDVFEIFIRDERWLTAEEATALKLNDRIVSL